MQSLSNGNGRFGAHRSSPRPSRNPQATSSSGNPPTLPSSPTTSSCKSSKKQGYHQASSNSSPDHRKRSSAAWSRTPILRACISPDPRPFSGIYTRRLQGTWTATRISRGSSARPVVKTCILCTSRPMSIRWCSRRSGPRLSIRDKSARRVRGCMCRVICMMRSRKSW